MTPETLRYRLNDLGLTQGGLARLLDADKRTVRRWCTGAQPIPEGLAAHLEQVTPDEVADAMAKSTGPREPGILSSRWVGARRGGR